MTIFIGLICNAFAIDPDCPKDGTGNEILADPEDCAKFWICRNYVPFPAYCPRENYFDIKTLTCVDPTKATCAGAPPSVPEVPEEPSSPEVQPTPVDCPKHMKPGDNVLLPNPKDCGSFYQCVYGYPHLLHCPGGLHFNNKKKFCDWPQIAECKNLLRLL